jgi:hypothetical protein
MLFIDMLLVGNSLIGAAARHEWSPIPAEQCNQ